MTVDRQTELKTAISCYDIVSAFGLYDFTEGIYEQPPTNQPEYEAGQVRQITYILDQLGCKAGDRLLDIGCGNGHLLEIARGRGAQVVGLTISKPQVTHCRAKGLDVRHEDFFTIDPEQLGGKFNALVANGSPEHFVQVADAAAGKADQIYTKMFGIAHRLLLPNGRLVTTTIHWSEGSIFNAQVFLDPNKRFQLDTDACHVANLVWSFGGWYPNIGQLERCAAGRFTLIKEVDGTNDYRLTSEYWLKQYRPDRVDLWCRLRLGINFLRNPTVTRRFQRCAFTDESWNWQFRGGPSPMRLLRQTWQK